MSDQSGRLLYVVGASGAGKDSIIEGCKAQLGDHASCKFARRFITRPKNAQGENHISLSTQEFIQRRDSNGFAMHWQANSYHYGIAQEINHWLASGYNVVVNGSRAHLDNATCIYGEMLLTVYVDVALDLLRDRLLKRNRESHAEVALRLERARYYNDKMPLNAHCIENNGAIEVAVDQLSQLIFSLQNSIQTPFSDQDVSAKNTA